MCSEWIVLYHLHLFFFTWFLLYIININKPQVSVDVKHGGVSVLIDLKAVKVEDDRISR